MSLFYPQDHMAYLCPRRSRLRDPCKLTRSPFHSGRSSDFRIILPAAPSHSTEDEQWFIAAFVPDYSGGPVPEFHGVPY